MKQNEIKYFSDQELRQYDATSLSVKYLIKSIYVKIRRNLWGRYLDNDSRVVWTVQDVSDAYGPSDNVRNYLERQTIRKILRGVVGNGRINAACEVGCGYGRIIMVLKEFANTVVGFERELRLVSIGKELLPDIEFSVCDSLDNLKCEKVKEFDLAMTCTVLQHMTDDFCRKVIGEIKRIAPHGYVLLIEKTVPINTTEQASDGRKFISRARPVELYAEWMRPFTLVRTEDRILEKTYDNKSPGTCMLFKSPGAD